VNGEGETYARWLARVIGTGMLGVSSFLLLKGQPVPVVYLLIAGALFGVDSLSGFELRKKNGKGAE
jgi:hypothetical protein